MAKSSRVQASSSSSADRAGASAAGDVFEIKRLRRLIELMEEFQLNELDLREGAMRIRLRKGGAAEVAAATSAPAQARTASAPPAAVEPAAADDKHTAFITSPMIGTFYASASPESPAFVKVGDPVGPETTVCIIEAMKVFNEIPAEKSGRIVAVLVENGAPVEFGQKLFKVDTRA